MLMRNDEPRKSPGQGRNAREHSVSSCRVTWITEQVDSATDSATGSANHQQCMSIIANTCKHNYFCGLVLPKQFSARQTNINKYTEHVEHSQVLAALVSVVNASPAARLAMGHWMQAAAQDARSDGTAGRQSDQVRLHCVGHTRRQDLYSSVAVQQETKERSE